MKYIIAFLLASLTAFSATVTGPVGDLSGSAFNPRVEFWPLSTPFNIGNTNIVGPPKTVSVVNGNFSQVLVAGRYLVKFPPTTNSFYIHVPNDTATYSLAAASTNVSSVTGIASAPVYRVKATSADTNAGFLSSKLVAGSGVTITTNNAGQDETLTITAAGGSTYTNNTGLPGVVLGSGIGTNLSTLATQSGLAAGSYAINGALLTNFNKHVIYVSKLPGINQNGKSFDGSGTDDWAIIQAALNTATNSGVGYLELVNDGASLLSKGLIPYSNTKIVNLGSLSMATNSLQPIIRNYPNATNIWIEGGVWNMNMVAQQASTNNPFGQGTIWCVDANTNSLWLNGFHFWQSNRFITIKDVTIREPAVWGIMWQDSLGDVLMENVRILRPISAGVTYTGGIQIWGNMTNFMCSNLYSEGFDDTLALQPSEPAYYQNSTNAGVLWSTNHGHLKNITYDGVTCRGNLIRFANYGGSYSFSPSASVWTNLSISGFTLRNVTFAGNATTMMNNDGSFTNSENIVFENWNVKALPNGGGPEFNKIQIVGFNVQLGRISNIEIEDTTDWAESVGHFFFDGAGSWVVNNITVRDRAATSMALFEFGAVGAGDTFNFSGITTDQTAPLFVGAPYGGIAGSNGTFRVTGVLKPPTTILNTGTFTNFTADACRTEVVSASIATTGWTNVWTTNNTTATVYVERGASVAVTLKNPANTTLNTFTAGTTPLNITLRPGYGFSASGNLSGNAVPLQ